MTAGRMSPMVSRSVKGLRRTLPWLAALVLCMACRKPAPHERVFTGNNGVRPGVTNDDTNNGGTPMSGAGGTSSGGTTEYGAAYGQPLAAIRCEPRDGEDPLGDAMLDLLDVLEDPALVAATSAEPALARVRQGSQRFRQRLEACGDTWLRERGASDIADRLQQRLTALDDALSTAPASLAVSDAVQALGDELESGAVTVHDLEPPRTLDAR
jgi:hypothetical protein